MLGELKSAIGIDEDVTEERTPYRCPECGNEFESFEVPERAFCDECVNEDVEVGEA